MNVFRQTSYTRLSKAVVICLGALLVCALGTALVHVTQTEHAYCESHQAFEHADESGELAEHGAHAQVTDGEATPPAGDPDSSDESCDWLSWLHGPSVPVPEMHASLLDLPPPATPLAARPLSAQAHVPSPIDLLRLSPGHSPPVRMHISA